MHRKAATLQLARLHAALVHQPVGLIGWGQRKINAGIAPRRMQRHEISHDGHDPKRILPAPAGRADEAMHQRMGDNHQPRTAFGQQAFEILAGNQINHPREKANSGARIGQLKREIVQFQPTGRELVIETGSAAHTGHIRGLQQIFDRPRNTPARQLFKRRANRHRCAAMAAAGIRNRKEHINRLPIHSGLNHNDVVLDQR